MSHGVEAARQCCPTAQEQVPCTGLVRWRCCPTNCMHSASMNSNADRISPSIPLQVMNVCRTSANPEQPAMGHSASGTTEGRTAGPQGLTHCLARSPPSQQQLIPTHTNKGSDHEVLGTTGNTPWFSPQVHFKISRSETMPKNC